MARRIVWFSGGAASAVAAQLTLERDPSAHVVYCDTMAPEHPDDKRFFRDVEAWLGVDIEVIHSRKCSTLADMFGQERYLSEPEGALFTVELKKIPGHTFGRPGDIHIFGYTAKEKRRISILESNNPELHLELPLRDMGFTRQDCFVFLQREGIELPEMYRLGLRDNYCLGCARSTSPDYWAMVREYFPDVFRKRCYQARALGVKMLEYKGKRVYLDELPSDIDFSRYTPAFLKCGPECGGQL